jgi:hypothetical protein
VRLALPPGAAAFSTAQLKADRIAFCSISVPDEGYGDLQRTAKYVVFAVRRMARLSGRKAADRALRAAAAACSGFRNSASPPIAVG